MAKIHAWVKDAVTSERIVREMDVPDGWDDLDDDDKAERLEEIAGEYLDEMEQSMMHSILTYGAHIVED